MGCYHDAEDAVLAWLDEHPIPLLPASTLHLASFRHDADLTPVYEQVNAALQ